jgi:hypothetical protein
MKHILKIVVLGMMACCTSVHAQTIMQPTLPSSFDTFVNIPGLSLRQLIDTLQTFISSDDTGEGGARDELLTFRKFWEGRVSANDSSGHNMFKKYYMALKREILAGRGDCGSSGFQGAWEPIGPDNLPTQTVGRVDAIWADPNDSNYILAGTPGGLFRTTNGGVNWECITDNAPLAVGIWGVTSIAVNPLNRNTIYISTGNNTTTARGGAGILFTYDGGSTWQQEFIPYFGSPVYSDTIRQVNQIFITPDSVRLYAFSGIDVFTRLNVGTSPAWWIITPWDFTGTIPNWTGLQLVPGDRNHFF